MVKIKLIVNCVHPGEFTIFVYTVSNNVVAFSGYKQYFLINISLLRNKFISGKKFYFKNKSKIQIE